MRKLAGARVPADIITGQRLQAQEAALIGGRTIWLVWGQGLLVSRAVSSHRRGQ